MNEALRAIARLLDYPTAELLENVDAVADALSRCCVPVARRAATARLIERYAGADLLDLQETYVETFDRGRRTSLNLFEHVHGDSRDRGQAMVDLLAMYREVGVELDSDQLPDYLPAFLEYASLLDPKQAREQLREVTHLLRPVGSVLAARGSDYAALFDLLLAIAGEAALEAEAAGEDDTSFAAIDAAWLDAPVDFLGAATPCASAQRKPIEQPVQFQRRTA